MRGSFFYTPHLFPAHEKGPHLDTAWCRDQDEFHQGILRCESAGVVFVSVVREEPMIQKSGEKTS